jgi:hypothetical protein
MLEKVWLRIDGLKIVSIEKSTNVDLKNVAFARIKVGASAFETDSYFSYNKVRDSVHLEVSQSRLRFLAVPIIYKDAGRRVPKMLLGDVIYEAIYNLYIKNGIIKNFILNNEPVLKTDFMRPMNWKNGVTLRVPIKYIELSNFRTNPLKTAVYASIRLDKQLIFWECLIFSKDDSKRQFVYGGDVRDAIKDQEIISIINNELLSRDDVREHVKFVLKGNCRSIFSPFVGVKGYNPSFKIPPMRIRFY